MDGTQSPLVTALPPHTDYISYLTIVQQYLSEATLPTLHTVLQDETLTSNIGWDLVQLLVPLLPASTDCLQDVARLGNPREVILKVTEALRLLGFQGDPEDDDLVTSKPKLSLQTPEKPVPLYVVQFDKLLSMLTLLHARIKTKYPSRFLSTTLEAVLASFSSAVDYKEEMIVSIVQMVKKMRGILRPALPSRSSSASLMRTISNSIAEGIGATAPDPEATTSGTQPKEDAIQLKLFQAFITYVLEDYLLNLTSHAAVPGLAWSSRLMETQHTERTIPVKKTMSKQFKEDAALLARNDAVGQLISLAHDLKISDTALVAAVTAPEAPQNEDEDEPPSSADDISLSATGAVLLLAARQASDVLHGRKTKQALNIFPQHINLISVASITAGGSTGSLGTEPEALVDACIVLGLLALESDDIGTPESDTQYKEYLQAISLLASECPSSNLRGHAHYLVTTMLRSHPDDKLRYAFIRDTLEHCPYENLKTAAVGWLKGEILEANMSPTNSEDNSVFRSSITLETLAPLLFPSVEAELVAAPLQSAWMNYQVNASFHLATLNFLYFLIAADQLRDVLDIRDLWNDNDLAGSYMTPLQTADERFKAALAGQDAAIPYDDETERQHLIAELNLLTNALSQVTMVVPKLNE